MPSNPLDDETFVKKCQEFLSIANLVRHDEALYSFVLRIRSEKVSVENEIRELIRDGAEQALDSMAAAKSEKGPAHVAIRSDIAIVNRRMLLELPGRYEELLNLSHNNRFVLSDACFRLLNQAARLRTA